MYQVLYRKYRPRIFSDVVGQEHITSTLAKEIETGKHSHAYLFTGSRGTGKTTCAKILSKAVNCPHTVKGSPCNECEICTGIDSGAILDVVEIDAASNNGVDNIRDIRDEINFTPASCKYRVYIIDEVHMLSIGAFNALLKTLEEPPAHVKFILATTEVHKLPVTILSRCQRFDFHRVTPEAMKERISFIAAQEGFTVTEEAVSLIARIADGGMRDALSLLDQCTGHGKEITAETVCDVAGLTGKDHLFSLADAVCKSDSAAALELISRLHSSSCDMERLCSDMINHFRNLMVVKTVRNPENLLVCTSQELAGYKTQADSFTLENVLYSIGLLQQCAANIKKGVNRRTELEMTFIKLSTPSLSSDNEALVRRIAELEGKLRGAVPVHSAPAAAPVTAPTQPTVQAPAAAVSPLQAPAAEKETAEKPLSPSRETAVPVPQPVQTAPEEEASPSAAQTQDEQAIAWPEVLSVLNEINAPLKGVLNGSTAVIRGDFVLINSANAALSAFIKTGRNAKDVKTAIEQVTGRKYRLGISNTEQSSQQSSAEKKDPLENFISRAQNLGYDVSTK